MGNTLARRFLEEAGELLASIVDFGLTEAKLDARWRARAQSLSVRCGVAFYDAAYHAVDARAPGCVRRGRTSGMCAAPLGAGGISSLWLWQTP